MTAGAMTKLAYKPLADLLSGRAGERLTSEQIGVLIGCDRRSIERYKVDGIPFDSIDGITTRLAANPIDIWPDYYGPGDTDDGDEPAPSPLQEHELEAHRDKALEALLRQRGIEFHLRWILLDDIDHEATEAARVRPVDPTTVWRYTEAVTAGEAFPAVLAGVHLDEWVILGGQHRLAAWTEAGATRIPAYTVDLPDPGDQFTLAVEHNARHGQGLTVDERIGAALTMIDRHGLSQADAAQRVGLTAHTIRKAAKAQTSGAMAQRLGLRTQWTRLSPSSQWRIGMAAERDETLFMEAVSTAAGLGLDTGQVYEMCADIVAGRRAAGLVGALQAVEDFESGHHKQRATTGGWGHGSAASGVGADPTVAFRQLAIRILDLDQGKVVDGCLPGDRVITADLCRRLAQRIAGIAVKLESGAKA